MQWRKGLNPKADENQYVNKSIYTQKLLDFSQKISIKSGVEKDIPHSTWIQNTTPLSIWDPKHNHPVIHEISGNRRKCFKKHLAIKLKVTDPL